MSPHRSRFISLVTLAALGSLLAGCGKNSPTSPSSTVSQQDADDAAQQVGFMMAANNGASPQSQLAGGAAWSSSARGSGASTLSSPTAVSSTDTTFAAGNITWTVSRSWFDAGGNEQGAYDPATTVRLSATSRGTGSIESAQDTASFGGAAALDVVGISALQDTLTTNAMRHDTLQCSIVPRFRPATRVFTYLESAGALANIVQLKPVSSNPWPLSGTATWSLKIDRLATRLRGSVTRHVDITVVVVFDGTQHPGVVVSGGWHYRLDLLTGLIVRA